VPGTRLAVLSYPAWPRHFGNDPSVIGRTIGLAGFPYEIVGVLPEGFHGTSIDGGPDVRVLLANRADFGQGPNLRDATASKIIARLRPEASIDSARAEAEVLWSRHREAFLAGGGVVSPFDRELSVELRSISNGTSRVREQFERTLVVLFGGAGLVFAMVCLNVGGLLLARTMRSSTDTAVRAALGATPGRIAREWSIEGVLIAAIGGVAALLLSAAAMPVLARWLSPLVGFATFGIRPTLDLSLDLRIAAFGLLAMVAAGIAVAVVPAFSAARKDVYRNLKAAADDRRTHRIQAIVCIVQIAVSTVLLLGCGLLGRTLANLHTVDAGFDRDRLVRFAFEPGLAGYDGAAGAAFQRRLLEEVAALPGIEGAAITTTPVMQGIGVVMVVAPPSRPATEGSWNTSVNGVSASYFQTAGLGLLAGTVFDDRPVATEEPQPVVVNEAFARRFFGDDVAVGRVFDTGAEFQTPTYRIVGVVSNASYRSLRESDPPIFYFNPLSREAPNAGSFSLLVRAASPDAIIEPVRAASRSIDPTVPIVETVTMSNEVGRSLWRERLATALIGAFAAVGLAVAAIGLHAILAFYVASRRREIGLRGALGARRLDVLRLIARRMTLVLPLGLLAGLAAHLAVGRRLTSLLYDVTLLDPAVAAAAGAALLAAAVLAGIVPALRALSVDPASTLRDE